MIQSREEDPSDFWEVIKAGKARPLKLPARSPNLNAFAERWVRSVREECLSRLIFFGENSLHRALITAGNGITRAKPTSFCFPPHEDLTGAHHKAQFCAENDWAAYLSTTSIEHCDYWIARIF